MNLEKEPNQAKRQADKKLMEPLQSQSQHVEQPGSISLCREFYSAELPESICPKNLSYVKEKGNRDPDNVC